MSRYHRPAAVLAAILAVVLVLVGCAKGTVASGPARHGHSFPVSVRAANGVVRIDQRPDRIVSLSPTATEMLFAIDAGDQVVAVDDQSDYPRRAPTTKLSGYQPNVAEWLKAADVFGLRYLL